MARLSAGSAGRPPHPPHVLAGVPREVEQNHVVHIRSVDTAGGPDVFFLIFVTKFLLTFNILQVQNNLKYFLVDTRIASRALIKTPLHFKYNAKKLHTYKI